MRYIRPDSNELLFVDELCYSLLLAMRCMLNINLVRHSGNFLKIQTLTILDIDLI